jgi:hypothetical protein
MYATRVLLQQMYCDSDNIGRRHLLGKSQATSEHFSSRTAG